VASGDQQAVGHGVSPQWVWWTECVDSWAL
jgi:hypothetical protein